MVREYTISISRMAKGKAGYQRNKLQFGWSFFPEEHTTESLIKLAAVDGYSFLAGHFERQPPKYYGRTDVFTCRITENFRETYIVPLDDDGKAANPLEYWASDPLFKKYGAGYYHTDSSTPARPRLRLLYELDQPIVDPDLYRTTRLAFGWYYTHNGQSQIDVLPQVPQVWFGCARPAKYKVFNKVLPLETLKAVVLDPYLQVQAAQKSTCQKKEYSHPGDDEINYILRWLATRQAGDNRNLCLLWAGAALKKKGQCWQSVGDQVVSACQQNGYLERYAKSENEIQRIFEKGRPI